MFAHILVMMAFTNYNHSSYCISSLVHVESMLNQPQ